MITKIIFILLVLSIEIPLLIKYHKAKFNITRQVAIICLMIIVFLAALGIYKTLLALKFFI